MAWGVAFRCKTSGRSKGVGLCQLGGSSECIGRDKPCVEICGGCRRCGGDIGGALELWLAILGVLG